MKSLIKNLVILVGASAFGLSVALVASHAQNVYWTPPSANAPGNNLYGLLNAGVVGQSKAGGLSLGGALIVNGASSYLYGPTIISPPVAPGINALSAYGKVQIQDGTQGAGKLFISNANGLGSWTSVNCGLDGSGVQMFLAGLTAAGGPNCVSPPAAAAPSGPTPVCSLNNYELSLGSTDVGTASCPSWTATRTGTVNISASGSVFTGVNAGSAVSLQLRGTGSTYIPGTSNSTSGTFSVTANTTYNIYLEVRASQAGTRPSNFNNVRVSISAQQP